MNLRPLVPLLALSPIAAAQDPCGIWNVVPTPVPSESTHTMLEEIAVVAPDDVWAVGHQYVPTSGGMETQTLAMHWNGASWTIVPSPSPSPYPGGGWADFQSVHAVSSSDVWAAGGMRVQGPDGFVGTHIMVQHWNGSSWSVIPAPMTSGGSGNFVDDIEVIAANDVWFVGDWLGLPDSGAAEKRALAMHWDGSGFTIHDTPFFDNGGIGGHGLTAVSAIASDDVWAVGGGHDGDYVGFSYIVHWNGSEWRYRPGPTPGWFQRLYDVHAVSTDEVYAVGDYQDDSGYHAMVLRWDGSSWTRLPDPPVGGASIEVLGPNQVYVGGAGIARWDGSSWSVVETFPSVDGPAVWSLETYGACSLWGSGRQWNGNEMEPLTVRLDPSTPGSSFCVTSQNSAGPGAEIAASGSTSISQASFTLHASGCPASQTGIFFYGRSQVQIPFGNGVMCVAGSIRRCAPVTTSSAGEAAQALSFSGSPITPGSTWNFQFWFRDPQDGGAAFNLSNGWTATFVQ